MTNKKHEHPVWNIIKLSQTINQNWEIHAIKIMTPYNLLRIHANISVYAYYGLIIISINLRCSKLELDMTLYYVISLSIIDDRSTHNKNLFLKTK